MLRRGKESKVSCRLVAELGLLTVSSITKELQAHIVISQILTILVNNLHRNVTEKYILIELTFGSLEVGESFGTRPFCLDKLPEFTGTPVFLLRDIFAEDQPVTLPSSPPTRISWHENIKL